MEIDFSKITRLEVINHANNSMKIGRLLVLYKSLKDFVEIFADIQDGGKTLKIFLK